MIMMMSMFSSFGALCGDIPSISLGSTNPNPKAISSGSSVHSASKSGEKIVNDRNNNQNRTKKSPTTPEKVAAPRRKIQRMPRFAPELDGVHCFETIVPY